MTVTTSKNKTKILILGITGMLGHQMWRVLRRTLDSQRFQIYGTVRGTVLALQRFDIFNTDGVIENVNASHFSELQKCLSDLQPDYVINCIGLTLRKKDLADIEKCYQINSVLPQLLGQWCELNHAKLIHFSTDCVFDGQKGSHYYETDLPTAQDHYGRSKFLGEVRTGKNLTFRLSIVGRELENKTEFLEWIFSQKNQTVSGFDQVMYSGLTTNFVAQEVCRVILKFPELSGLHQISSESLSKFAIINKVNQKFYLNIQVNKKSDYVSNKSLDCSAYSKQTGFKSPTWDELIDDLYQDREFYERLS